MRIVKNMIKRIKQNGFGLRTCFFSRPDDPFIVSNSTDLGGAEVGGTEAYRK